jgi:DNA polymerase III epsilon subunit-like protein
VAAREIDLCMKWTDTPIHFIDFEGSAASGILELGVVTLLGGEITATHTRLCRATGPVAVDDTKVHGLSADGLASQAYFAAEWERFAGLRATGPLAAHFAPVENSLLRKVWPYPRESPDFARPGKTATEWGPWIDTGRLYPQLFPQLGSVRLEDLVVRQGLQPELETVSRSTARPSGGATTRRSTMRWRARSCCGPCSTGQSARRRRSRGCCR